MGEVLVVTQEVIEKNADELRREQHRKWQRLNREKVRAYQKRYWEKKATIELSKGKNKNDKNK